MKQITIKTKIPLYFGRLIISVSKELNKLDTRLKGEPNFDALTDTFIKNSLLHVQICLQPDATPSIMAHEAVHAANMIFEHVGVKLNLKNDEPQAYLVGWVVKQLTIAVDRYNKTFKD
jgi:hypothetical protein